MLLFELILQDQLTVSLPELVVDKRAWNRAENEHVKKDENNEKNIIGFIILNSKQLIVWIRVVCCCNICYEDHPAQRKVVTLVRIYCLRVCRVLIKRINCKCSISYQSKTTNYNTKKDHENQNIRVSWNQRNKDFLCLGIVKKRKH